MKSNIVGVWWAIQHEIWFWITNFWVFGGHNYISVNFLRCCSKALWVNSFHFPFYTIVWKLSELIMKLSKSSFHFVETSRVFLLFFIYSKANRETVEPKWNFSHEFGDKFYFLARIFRFFLRDFWFTKRFPAIGLKNSASNFVRWLSKSVFNLVPSAHFIASTQAKIIQHLI